MSSKNENAECAANAVAGLIARIDAGLVELGKLTGYGPEYRDAKAKWTELRAKFRDAAKARDAKTKAKAAAKKSAHSKSVAKKPAPTKSVAKKPAPMKSATKKPAPAAKVTKDEVTKAQPQEKSVKTGPNEIVLNLNGFMTQSGAAHDASELLTYPNVFRYRSTMFPDPRRYGVQPTIVEAKAIERKGTRFVSRPWTVRTRITVVGPEPKVSAWCQAVLAKNKHEQE